MLQVWCYLLANLGFGWEHCKSNNHRSTSPQFLLLYLDLLFPDRNVIKSYSMLKFTTKFPYLDEYEKISTLIRKVDIALPQNKRILGYLINFTLKVFETTSSFTSMSEHQVFVYYRNIAMYESFCFPTRLYTSSPW